MEQKNKYERISLAERIEIYKLLGQDKNYSFIANELGRHKSSIQREVSRLGRMKYTAMNANFTMVFNSSKRRLNKTKMSQNPELKSYVLQKLELRWSPEQISLTLKRDYPNNPDMNISHEAIYLHVYIHSGPELRLQLRQKRKVRGNTRRGKDKRTTIVDPIRIDERPEEVIGREIPGHWEGDLVMGKESESAIGTLVERTTRTIIIVPLKKKDATSVRKAFEKEFQSIPRQMKKTLTYDNGSEMAQHKLFKRTPKYKSISHIHIVRGKDLPTRIVMVL